MKFTDNIAAAGPVFERGTFLVPLQSRTFHGLRLEPLPRGPSCGASWPVRMSPLLKRYRRAYARGKDGKRPAGAGTPANAKEKARTGAVLSDSGGALKEESRLILPKKILLGRLLRIIPCAAYNYLFI